MGDVINEQKQACCFSGHRKLSRVIMPMMLKRLKSEIENLAKQDMDTFISGGAVGFDQIAASMVIAVKELGYPDIKLVFALPCKDQDWYWKQKEKNFYKELLLEADEIVYVSEKYHRDVCMREIAVCAIIAVIASAI